jgi:hypothetical protein
VATAPTQLVLPVSRAGFAVGPLSACTGLRLSGQADLCVVDLLQQAIAALPPDAGEIHLQLASLEYIDVAAGPQAGHADRPPTLPAPGPALPPGGHAQAAHAVLARGPGPGARARFAVGAARPDGTWTGGGKHP